MPIPDPNSQVVSALREVLPDRFLRDVTHAILRSYRDADMQCGDIHQRFIRQDRPQKRRNLIDTRLEEIARRHFEIQGAIKDNIRNSHSYTELTVKDRVVITASSTHRSHELPRPSKFRLEAAAQNPAYRQLNILHSNLIQVDFQARHVVADSSLQSSKLYAVVIHGPSQGNSPGYIKLVVPDSDYQYFVGTIDLLGNYANQDLDFQSDDMISQDIPRPSARLRVRQEEYIEEEDRAEGEDPGGIGGEQNEET
jgi:hypothetical protein